MQNVYILYQKDLIQEREREIGVVDFLYIVGKLSKFNESYDFHI